MSHQTLKSIAQNALQQISGFDVPTSFVGNQEATAVLCLALANQIGKFLERTYRWTALITEATITTVANQASYDKPEDFRAFANMSQWDRSNFLPLHGPTSPNEWQWLKGSQVTSGIERWFRVKGSQIFIHPTPTAAGDTLAYEYYSTRWVVPQAGGTNTEAFANDLDTTLLDELVMTLELRWRFLAAKGFPFEAEYKEAEALRDSIIDDDGGSRLIKMGGTKMLLDNLPETSFGL